MEEEDENPKNSEIQEGFEEEEEEESSEISKGKGHKAKGAETLKPKSSESKKERIKESKIRG